MRIVRAEQERGKVCWAVVDGETVRHLQRSPFDGEVLPQEPLGELREMKLLPPTRPTKIVCVGRNYRAHAAEHGAEVPTEPLLFLKPPSSVIGHRENIRLPALSDHVEHEAELALVIGRRCRRVAADDAWENVFGVTCANDVTARDLQRSDSQWTRGKGFDTFCPIGPWIETGLTREDVGGLGICCRVNGEKRQESNTASMVFSPSQLISYITQVMTLDPGDLILTGTPSGVSPLKTGDEVEVEIDRIGTLRNPVADDRFWNGGNPGK